MAFSDSPFRSGAFSSTSPFMSPDSVQRDYSNSGGNSRSGFLSSIGSFLGPFGSLVGSGIDYLLGKKGQSSQARENQLNREFNERMMRMQNRFALDMFNRTNAYNDPSSVLSRLRKAGINPALYYSQGQIGGLAAATEPSGGASSQGFISNPFTSSVGSNIGVASRSAAETALIQAQTRKINAEADISESDASIRDQLNRGILEFQGVQIRLSSSSADLTDAQIKTIQPTIDRIKSESTLLQERVNEVRANAASLSAQAVSQMFDNLYKTEYWKTLIAEMRSRINANNANANLSYSQANEIMTLLSSKLLNLQTDTALKREGVTKVSNEAAVLLQKIGVTSLEGERLDFDLQLDKKMSETERKLKMISAVFSGLSGGIGMIAGAISRGL